MGKGVLRYLGGRLLQALLVLLVIVTVLFLIFRLAPGNPLAAYVDTNFTEEQQNELLDRFGLDKPLGIQYLIYLKNLALGDFGDSFLHRRPVIEMITEVLPNTLYLNFFSLILAYLIGVIGGIVMAWFRGSRFEKFGVTLTLLSRAAPQFWVGMILLSIFAFTLNWLPSSGATSAGSLYETELQKLLSPDFWRHLVLPSLTMAFYLHGMPLLLMRSNMLEILQDDFITMGSLMGYSNWRLMVKHAARNALLPVVTALALGIGYSIGGNVVIENVFGWPGIGRLLVKAVASADYPVAQGAFFFIALFMLLMNFLADFLYGVLDPRVGSSDRAKT